MFVLGCALEPEEMRAEDVILGNNLSTFSLFAVKIFCRSAQGIVFNESSLRINFLINESVFLC